MNAEIKKLNYLQTLEQDLRALRTENAELKVLLKGNQAIVKDMTRDNFELKDKLDESEQALANALAGDERVKESDAIIMSKIDRINELEMINDEHKKMNGKLQTRLTELEQENIELHVDNKKLAKQIDDQLNSLRKAGVL
jgi:septal ring factor EnvC (AmiA/AmiB activator)